MFSQHITNANTKITNKIQYFFTILRMKLGKFNLMSTESKQLDHDIDIPNITSQKAPSKQMKYNVSSKKWGHETR